MDRDKLGSKHTCSNCGTKFFDLQKEIPVCPNCGTEVVIRTKPRLGRPPLNKDLKKPQSDLVNDKTKTNNENETIKEDDIEINEDIDNLVSLEEIDENTESIDESEADLDIIANEENDDNLSEITDIEINNDDEN